MSSTFCALPFMSIDIAANGHYSICCDADPLTVPVREHTADQWFAHDGLEEVRELMRAECVPLACRRCFQKEAQGRHSMRQTFNEHFEKGVYAVGREIVAAPRARMISYRFGNKCNLTCLMCGSETSSAFNAEARILDNEPELRIRHELRASNELLRDLRILYLGGGEPSLSRECLELLERLQSAGNTEALIVLSSNGSQPDAPLFKKLKEFRRVRVEFSIDGCGDTFELLRYPLTWTRLTENLDRFMEAYPAFDFGLVFTLNCLNTPNLPATLRWWIGFNERHGARLASWRTNDLFHPEFLSTGQVGPRLRERVLRELQELRNERAGRADFASPVIEDSIRKISEIRCAPVERLARELEAYVRRRAAHREFNAEPVLARARTEPAQIAP